MFARRPVRVRVPATSANLGPGFDSFGLALGLWDEVIAAVVEEPGFTVTVEGEGAESLPLDDTHLVARAMARGFDAMGVPTPGIVLRCLNSIPHGRGMGSSAAAIVGGLMAARGLVADGRSRMSDSDLLDIATAMEGHADNVGAALYGGLTIAIIDSMIEGTDGAARAHVTVVRHAPDAGIAAVVAIPPGQLSTSHARAVLPSTVDHADAAFNVGRAAVLVQALTVDPSVLMLATEDRLHQQQRAEAYPDSLALVSQLRGQGTAAVISGAGPSVIALTEDPAGTLDLVARHVPEGWVVISVSPDAAGARLLG